MLNFKKYAEGIDDAGKKELDAMLAYADSCMTIKDEEEVINRAESTLRKSSYQTIERAIDEINLVADNKKECEGIEYQQDERVILAVRFATRFFKMDKTQAMYDVARIYGKNEADKEKAAAKLKEQMIFKSFVSYTRNGAEKLDPYCVRRYIENNTQMLIVKTGGKEPDLYRWNKGVYKRCDDAGMRSIVRKVLERAEVPHLFDTKSAMEIMKQICSKDEGDEGVVYERDLNSDEDIINFKNGMLHLSDMTLTPHDPHVPSTVQIQADWSDHDIQTPVFDRYLSTLTDGDADLQTLLLEYVGGCLSNVDCRAFKKFLLMVGNGDTGKSVLLTTTINMLGEKNVGVSSFEDMQKQFGMSAFDGKRLVCNPDMNYMRTSDMSKLKQITGRDLVSVERKFKDSSNLNFRGLMWFIANDLPRFGSDAEGQYMYDRFLVVSCNNVIPAEQRDRKLTEKIMKEADGIARKAIVAFKKACERGYEFTEPASVRSARKSYMTANSDVISFMENMMIRVDERFESCVTKQRIQEFTFRNIYKAYTYWYKEEYGDSKYVKGQKDFKCAVAQYLHTTPEKMCGRGMNGMYIEGWYPNWIAWQDYNLCNVDIISGIAPLMFGVDSNDNVVVSDVCETAAQFRKRIEQINGMLYRSGMRIE